MMGPLSVLGWGGRNSGESPQGRRSEVVAAHPCDNHEPMPVNLGADPDRDGHAVRRATGASTRRRRCALMHHLVEHGSDGLVVCGTTGEAATLDRRGAPAA